MPKQRDARAPRRERGRGKNSRTIGVEQALATREFRELMFLNAVRLHSGMNPHFFDGTVVEAAARDAALT